MDLIAIPWVDVPKDEFEMIKHFDREINGIERVEKRQYYHSILPGGRKSYVIDIRRGGENNGIWEDAQFYLDISVTPSLKPVQVLQDDSCHWYVIPNELLKHFLKDNENAEMADTGEFGDKYDQYRTNGDINNIQLYAIK